MVPPETTEEKIVFDADCLDRLGIIGVLRGFIGKSGSITGILEQKMKTRANDYEKLHYNESKSIGKELNKVVSLAYDLFDTVLKIGFVIKCDHRGSDGKIRNIRPLCFFAYHTDNVGTGNDIPNPRCGHAETFRETADDDKI